MDLDSKNLKYTFLYSPRTNYTNKLEEEQKLYLDLAKSVRMPFILVAM